MGLFALPTVQIPDSAINRAFGFILQALNPLLADPFNSGVTLPSIAVTAATPFNLAHGLGRVPAGYFVVAFNGPVGCLLTAGVTPPDQLTSQLVLIPSATGTASIRVF